MMRHEHDGLFYWKGDTEIDLLCRQGNDIKKLLQSAYEGLDNQKTLQREIRALEEGHKIYPKAEQMIITANIPKKMKIPKPIQVMPMWHFLLQKT
jgi:hypothetical protein